ncbi:MAG: hypothetical protein J6T35_02070 [Bacteroidales bacterium]|nr:hypothetical protein [Bacteroidales bacterium]
MKRVIKIDERVWWDDDHMNGWGTVALVGGCDDRPEYIEGPDTIVTIAKDGGGEIETTVERIYHPAPYTFHGYPCVWEHADTDDDYPLFCPEFYENCFFSECEPKRDGGLIMVTTIIITEYYGKNGKYWTFNIETGNGDQVAEIDRYEKGYKIYSGGFPFKTEMTTRTKKDAAFEVAKDVVRNSMFGGIIFKHNVIRWHEK